jgi:3-deoxy-7-phosphoheptulonate synthase
MSKISRAGLSPVHIPGANRILFDQLGAEHVVAGLALECDPAIETLVPTQDNCLLASRDAHPEDTVVRLGRAAIGGKAVTVIAGPCAVESAEQIRSCAHAVSAFGAAALRGGAYKPRTSPYSFCGLGLPGLLLLREVGDDLALPIVTEVLDTADVDLVAEHSDMLQIGARSMQNAPLLKAVGRAGRPVLLKRGFAATIEELLLAAEYILMAGNDQVVLCERGIRTFETATRNTLDLNAIPFIKQRSHLPVLVDPSHGTGIRELVTPMALAAVACGADGLLIEVHPNPQAALSDGNQSLYPQQFERLMARLAPVAAAVGRSIA